MNLKKIRPNLKKKNQTKNKERGKHAARITMPTYDYLCQSCNYQFEKFESISARPAKKCPDCGKLKLKRLIGTGAGVIFKGSGFYETDYRSESYKKGQEKEKGSSKESKASKKEDKPKGKETKPDTKTKAKSEAKKTSEK